MAEMSEIVPDLHQVVKEIAEEMRLRPVRGEVARYIPELARVDPKHFGIAVIDADGNVATGGDSDMLKDGETVKLTQSAVVLEKLIGQFLYSKAADAGEKK